MLKKIIVLLVLIAMISAKKHKLLKKKCPNNGGEVKVLPHPPNGGGLKNHFGLKLGHGPWGKTNSIDYKRFILKDHDGRRSSIATAAGGPIQSASISDISQNSYAKFCASINDCDKCTNSENCGTFYFIKDGVITIINVCQKEAMVKQLIFAMNHF